MEVVSPSCASQSNDYEGASTACRDFAMEEDLYFSDSLKDLRNLHSQLNSAAEYFEMSYREEEEKRVLLENLKDYVQQACVNTVDHLASMVVKFDNLLEEKVDLVSELQIRLSWAEQKVGACQEKISQAGFSEQTLAIGPVQRYHKHYILQGDELIPMVGDVKFHETIAYMESRLFQDAILLSNMDCRHSFDFGVEPESPSSSPNRLVELQSPNHSRSPSPQPTNIYPDTGEGPEQQQQQVNHVGSRPPRPNIPRCPTIAPVSRAPESPKASSSSSMLKSLSVRFREDGKEGEHVPSKGKHFLKSLLSKRRSKKEDASANMDEC